MDRFAAEGKRKVADYRRGYAASALAAVAFWYPCPPPLTKNPALGETANRTWTTAGAAPVNRSPISSEPADYSYSCTKLGTIRCNLSEKPGVGRNRESNMNTACVSAGGPSADDLANALAYRYRFSRRFWAGHRIIGTGAGGWGSLPGTHIAAVCETATAADDGHVAVGLVE